MDNDEEHQSQLRRPDCFVVTSEDGIHTIEYRRERGCLNGFLAFWLFGWTLACGWLIICYFRGEPMEDAARWI